MRLKIYKMKKQFIFLLVGLFLLQGVNAYLGEFEIGECVPIRTVLNTSAVNISSIHIPAPNNTVLYLNELMTKNGQTFNFTFCDTDVGGTYVYDYCSVEGDCFENDFLVNPRGKSIDTARSIVYVILLLSNLLLLAFFVFLSIKVPYANISEEQEDGKFIVEVTKTKYVKLISIWLAAGSFLWFITILTGLTNNYIYFEELRSLMTNMHLFLSTVIGIGLSTFMVFFLLILMWKDIILSRHLRKFGKKFINEFSK